MSMTPEQLFNTLDRAEEIDPIMSPLWNGMDGKRIKVGPYEGWFMSGNRTYEIFVRVENRNVGAIMHRINQYDPNDLNIPPQRYEWYGMPPSEIELTKVMLHASC